MYIRNLLTVFFISFSLHIFANVDSLRVENNNGKKLIVHKVEASESYYSLGRKYGVTPKDIIDYNKNISLQPGTLLYIPTDRPFITENIQQKMPVTAGTSVFDYKVGPKETLFAIAKRFGTTVEDIQQLNNIKDTNLSIGQLIKVRLGLPPAPKPEPVASKPETVVPAVNTAEEEISKIDVASKVPLNKYGLREHNERGIATWIDDENVDGTKLLALHQTAPIGTVIKITNPMTDKSTFAKVVGKFTDNESTRDVIIVLTKAAAELIGAMDKRFQVSIDYGLNE